MSKTWNQVMHESYFDNLHKYLKDEKATLKHLEQLHVGERLEKGPLRLE